MFVQRPMIGSQKPIIQEILNDVPSTSHASGVGKTLNEKTCVPSLTTRLNETRTKNRFSCLAPGLDWTRLFMSLTAGAGTRCMSLLRDSPTLCSPKPRFVNLDFGELSKGLLGYAWRLFLVPRSPYFYFSGAAKHTHTLR